MHSIRIDRGKRLGEEPGCGHNRFHPDIAPIVEVGEFQLRWGLPVLRCTNLTSSRKVSR